MPKNFFSICIFPAKHEVSLFMQKPFFFLDMRRDVQEIFKMTPHEKQVMMFSATLNKEIRPVCKKFMQDVIMKAVLLFGFFIQLIWYLTANQITMVNLHLFPLDCSHCVARF